MATTVLSEFKTGDKVIAASALRRIPVGTKGTVIHTQGLTWPRYWVRFENGERLGTIDRSKLATAAEWERTLNGSNDVEVAVSPTGALVDAGSAVAEGSSVMESVNGIPGHLVERSRVARERWAAKKS